MVKGVKKSWSYLEGKNIGSYYYLLLLLLFSYYYRYYNYYCVIIIIVIIIALSLLEVRRQGRVIFHGNQVFINTS